MGRRVKGEYPFFLPKIVVHKEHSGADIPAVSFDAYWTWFSPLGEPPGDALPKSSEQRLNCA